MEYVCGKEIQIDGTVIRIARLDGEGYQFLEDPKSALEELKESKRAVDLFTFIPRVADTSPRHCYPTESDNVAALPISSFDHWMKVQIDFKVRNKVRKAEKNGVIVREVPFDTNLIQGVHAIYNESPIRQGKRFWHYGKDLDAIRRMNGTFMDRSIFIGAFFEDRLIGFVKLVSDESGQQAGLMQIISMIQHRDKAPTNALIAQAVRSCSTRSIPHLWYANFSYGNKQTDSLADFKRHNGFLKVEIPRYYVPLTATGRLALQLGVHHGVREWIPEPIAARYRQIRSLWYARRFPGFQNA